MIYKRHHMSVMGDCLLILTWEKNPSGHSGQLFRQFNTPFSSVMRPGAGPRPRGVLQESNTGYEDLKTAWRKSETGFKQKVALTLANSDLIRLDLAATDSENAEEYLGLSVIPMANNYKRLELFGNGQLKLKMPIVW